MAPHTHQRDQRHAARDLEKRTRGRWVCWWGPRTGRYFAMPSRGHLVLAEGETIRQLAQRMTEVDPYTSRQLDGSYSP